ncbi:MAG: biopolymer transporter ExbD [Bacteroidia bacterium]|nr:biopolymer transporter ExbD [Bacteroidia bacterium]
MLKKKKKKSVPAISTASLPDIVFMLLFFFMVATKMKEVTLKVEIKRPFASFATKLDDTNPIKTVYVGRPITSMQGVYGTESRIQINDVIASDVNGLVQAVDDWRNEIGDANVPKLTVLLKIDRNTKMGVVNDIKKTLRDREQYKIAYSSSKGDDPEENN